MNWFGRKAAQHPARPALSRVYGNWAAPASLSWEAQVREGYLSNAIVQRAVRLIAEAAGSAPVVASDPALGALVAATSGGQGLVETLAAQILLHGNGYVQILADGAGAPAELFALRPERVTVEADSRGWPVAYRYKAGGASSVLPAEDGAGRTAIIHVKALHPLDDHYGAGNLCAAAGAIAAHNAAAKWNAALLENAARPSGALVHDPGDKGVPLSADQIDRLAEGGQAAVQWASHADAEMAEIAIPPAGAALRPLAPVHGALRPDGSGGVQATWVRRSRFDTGWRDHVDLPPGESVERWRVELVPPVPGIAPWETGEAAVQVDAVQMASIPPGTQMAIRQTGDFALSPPLLVPLT